jgi:hypothetical protein
MDEEIRKWIDKLILELKVTEWILFFVLLYAIVLTVIVIGGR